MTSRFRISPLVAALGIASLNCGESVEAEESDEAQFDALVQGQELKAKDFPSALQYLIQFNGKPGFYGCTGARVGDRLILTAAHCVYDTYGGVFVERPGTARIGLEVAERLVFPETDQCLKVAVDANARGLCVNAHPDVALLRLKSSLPASIAVGPVDSRPVLAGQTLVLVGAGKSETTTGTLQNDDLLRFGSAYAIWPTWSRVVSSSKELSSAYTFYNRDFVLSPGWQAGDSVAVGASGDSGGPVYRFADGAFRIAAVHSAGGATDRPSLHTRVDDVKGVASWLKLQGSATMKTSTPATRTCAAGLRADGSLPLCVRDADGIAPTAALSVGLRALCEADKKLPTAQQPPRLSEVASCTQKGLPITLLHRWAQGL